MLIFRFVLGLVGGEGYGHPVVERTTFAFLTIPSMTSTKMDTRARDTYTALSMKSISTAETLSKEVFMTMKHPALSSLSSHVVQC